MRFKVENGYAGHYLVEVETSKPEEKPVEKPLVETPEKLEKKVKSGDYAAGFRSAQILALEVEQKHIKLGLFLCFLLQRLAPM